MRYVALILAALTLLSCNDPNYAKQKYLQSGNKYFAAGHLSRSLDHVQEGDR